MNKHPTFPKIAFQMRCRHGGYLWQMGLVFLFLIIYGAATQLVTPSLALAGNFELGLEAYHQAAYDLAIRYFQKAATENHSNANVHYYLADALVKAGRFTEAQVAYQQVLALAPGSQAARFSEIALANLPALEKSRQQGNGLSRRLSASRARTTDKFNLLVQGDSYYDDIMDSGRYIRWSTLDLPLRVHIERSPAGVHNFQPGFVSSIPKALDIWSTALDRQLTYVLVDNPEKAHLRIKWVDSIDTRGNTSEAGTTFHAGIATPFIKNNQLLAVEMTLATFDIRKKPQTMETVFSVALHEMGHALGLLGHSNNPNDIMYPRNQSKETLSPRDKNTIRKLYANVADITNLPPSAEETPERTKELADRLDSQIVKEEILVRQKGDNLSWLNLGTSYFNKGKRLEKSAGKQAAQDWYDKSVEAISKAIALEPKAAMSYYNRCVVYQEFNDLPHALTDIDQAIAYSGGNSIFYREKAWILAKMKQKAQATSTLQTYLIQKPGQANSAEVKKIQQLINAL